MLVARSSPECHLYIRLHPCECGERALVTQHDVVSSALPPPAPADAGLVARYRGACGACNRARAFDFALHPDIPPADAFGGAAASAIICPGEFALHSDELSARWPASPAAIRAEDRGRARLDLFWAVRALEEVVKFIPPGAEAVPAEAFTSAAGRAAYQREPGRFRAVRLGSRLAAYRGLLVEYDGAN